MHPRPVPAACDQPLLDAVSEAVPEAVDLGVRLVRDRDVAVSSSPELLGPVVELACFAGDVLLDVPHEVHQLLRVVWAREQMVVVGGEDDGVEPQAGKPLGTSEDTDNAPVELGARSEEKPALDCPAGHLNELLGANHAEWSSHLTRARTQTRPRIAQLCDWPAGDVLLSEVIGTSVGPANLGGGIDGPVDQTGLPQAVTLAAEVAIKLKDRTDVCIEPLGDDGIFAGVKVNLGPERP